jgi:hypothetical protein
MNRAETTAGKKNQLTKDHSVVAGFRCCDTIKKTGHAPPNFPTNAAPAIDPTGWLFTEHLSVMSGFH